jgi:4-diphosphocytidyl-2-C-methyl-D-erythritol kinase
MRSQPLTISAPAKVNLFLSVLGRRPDGYHEIRTILQTISLKDRLQFHPAKDSITFQCSDPSVPAAGDNLCVRAARLMRAIARRAGRNPGVHIALRKAIPMQAGLGGGSSDAAATLIALNCLWGLRMGLEQLAPLAARLGSDVPFFLRGGTALALGRGEIVVPLPEAGARVWLVAVKPAVGVSTSLAYQEWDRRRLLPGGDCGAAVSAVSRATPEAIASALHNDFERVILRQHRILAAIKRDLVQAGCLGALLCGSGAAVSGIAPSKHLAQRAASSLEQKYGWAKAVHTVGSARWTR